MSTRPYSLAELIGFQVDELLRLQRIAANERRPHRVTEQLVDGLTEVSRTIHRLGRG